MCEDVRWKVITGSRDLLLPFSGRVLTRQFADVFDHCMEQRVANVSSFSPLWRCILDLELCAVAEMAQRLQAFGSRVIKYDGDSDFKPFADLTVADALNIFLERVHHVSNHGATLVGWLLTDDISKVFAATALGAGLATLGSAIVIRAGLQAKEDHNE